MKNNRKITCVDRHRKKYSVSVDKLSFRPAVYGIIIQNNKVLLSPQWDGYDFPGGGVELGEPIKSALKREVKEETGFDVKAKQLVACENDFFKFTFKREEYAHSILIYYLCQITGGKLSTELFDADEKQYARKAEWVDLKKTENIKFYNSADSLEILKKAEQILEK